MSAAMLRGIVSRILSAALAFFVAWAAVAAFVGLAMTTEFSGGSRHAPAAVFILVFVIAFIALLALLRR